MVTSSKTIEIAEINGNLNYEQASTIPSGVQFKITRYTKPDNWLADDYGIMNYKVVPEHGVGFLELNFCVIGNMYCSKNSDCNICGLHNVFNCKEKIETVDHLSFTFSKEHLQQYTGLKNNSKMVTDNVLAFQYNHSFQKSIPICSKTRLLLAGILDNEYPDTLQNIYVNAQTQMLLIYCMECLQGEREINILTCRFLANDADREKIEKAREILLEQIGEPITIKELSKKVAINECYLKKGFKEMYGTTIFDFYHGQRMEHAKFLLYEKGMSVTEVSVMLGYSSISHFSTAFKKHTGLKPCELLFR